MKTAIKILGSMLLMLNISSCYYDVDEELYPSSAPCDTTNITYSGKVLPIIQNNCYTCHSASASLGNINLEGFNNLKIFANNGRLSGVINHIPGFSPMPKGGNKLSDCDIMVIDAWIAQGVKNN